MSKDVNKVRTFTHESVNIFCVGIYRCHYICGMYLLVPTAVAPLHLAELGVINEYYSLLYISTRQPPPPPTKITDTFDDYSTEFYSMLNL